MCDFHFILHVDIFYDLIPSQGRGCTWRSLLHVYKELPFTNHTKQKTIETTDFVYLPSSQEKGADGWILGGSSGCMPVSKSKPIL